MFWRFFIFKFISHGFQCSFLSHLGKACWFFKWSWNEKNEKKRLMGVVCVLVDATTNKQHLQMRISNRHVETTLLFIDKNIISKLCVFIILRFPTNITCFFNLLEWCDFMQKCNCNWCVRVKLHSMQKSETTTMKLQFYMDGLLNSLLLAKKDVNFWVLVMHQV
jgi:hypothetical protein